MRIAMHAARVSSKHPFTEAPRDASNVRGLDARVGHVQGWDGEPALA